jgi:hypothetical protein
MIVSSTWLGIIAGLLTLIIWWAKWWMNRNDETQKEKKDAKTKISDAASSGDVSRINGIIQWLRRKT